MKHAQAGGIGMRCPRARTRCAQSLCSPWLRAGSHRVDSGKRGHFKPAHGPCPVVARSSTEERRAAPPVKDAHHDTHARTKALVDEQTSVSYHEEGVGDDGELLSLYGSIFAIAGPAFVALTADPVASLVDSAWIGRIGSVPLAASGLAVSVLNIVVKLFNTPLLSVTTSVVARAYANPKSDLGKAASTAVELGLVSGVVQAALLYTGASLAISWMGVDSSTDPELYHAAVSFLSLRALGTPAVVLLLSTQGIFRGVGDTVRPLYATLGGNFLNVILDPVLILLCGMGLEGAAIATVASEYVAAGYLLWVLHDKHMPGYKISFNMGEQLKGTRHLLGPSAVLGFRSLCVVSTYAIASSLSLKAGDGYAAAHQVSHQLWLGSTLVADALAVAAQTLIAQGMARGSTSDVKEIAVKTCGLGLALGCVSASIIFTGHTLFPTLFSSDTEVVEGISRVMPFVVWTQPLTALAFVLDGVLYGGDDFNFAAVAMFVAAVPAIGVMLGSNLVEDPGSKLDIIWWGYTVLMAMRMGAILFRVRSKGGPFKKFFWPSSKSQ